MRIRLLSIYTLLTAVLGGAIFSAHAQPLHHLTLRDGLAGLSVTDLCEDPSGLMWIATSNGVTLFNGRTMSNYELPSLSDGRPNYCFQISLNSHGDLYAATRGGLYRLRRYAARFERVTEKIETAECLLCDGDVTWVGNRSGLYCLTSKGEVQLIGAATADTPANPSVRCLRHGSDSSVWLSTRNSITCYDPKSGEAAHYPLETPSGLSKFVLTDTVAWVGTKNNSLYRLCLPSGQASPVEGLGAVVTGMEATDDGRLLVATDGTGAYVLDIATGRITAHYQMGSDDEQRRLPANAVYAIKQTQTGSLWLGMFQQGFCYQSFHYPLFHDIASTRGQNITSLLIDRDRMIYGVPDGIFVADTTGADSHFYDTRQWGIRMPRIIVRHGDYYYICSYDAGLLRLHIATGLMERVPGVPPLAYATVSGCDTDGLGRLWLTTSEGIFIIDSDQQVSNYNERNSKVPMGLHNIVFDRQGNGWIGSSSMGTCLVVIDGQGTPTFKTSDFPANFFHNIKGTSFRAAGDSIIAYTQNLLFHTDAQMTHFGPLPVPRQVLSEKCIDFLDDRHGHYWLITERGLFVYSPRSHEALMMGATVGQTADMVASNTMQTDDNGHLWVGTTDGVKRLTLNDLDSIGTTIGLHTLLEAVTIGSRRTESAQLLRLNDERRMDIGWHWTSSEVTIVPTMSHFAQQTGDMYEWRVDNGRWEMLPAGEAVTLSGLSPGRHHLTVRYAGVPSTATDYVLRVYPLWWVWAEAALVVVALAIAVWVIRYRRRTNRLLAEHRATEQALIDEGIRQQQKVTDTEQPKTAATEQEKGTEQEKAADEREKYQKARVSDRELRQLARRMKEFVEEKRPYLNADSKMSDIAAALGVSPSLLSQVFTLYLKENYYDYINRYRLEEFKRLIQQGKHHQYTVTALSEQCGFKKTSFFSTMRKVEGKTPTEYIQTVGS